MRRLYLRKGEFKNIGNNWASVQYVAAFRCIDYTTQKQHKNQCCVVIKEIHYKLLLDLKDKHNLL